MWDYNDRVWGKMLGDYGPGELMAEWVRGIPMNRAGTPAEVGGLVAFLASTGRSLHHGPDDQRGRRTDHVLGGCPEKAGSDFVDRQSGEGESADLGKMAGDGDRIP